MTYKRRSVNRHGVHSPFLFDLVENVFRGPKNGIESIEAVRKKLIRDKSCLNNLDLGAGSSSGVQLKRVRDIAKHSLSTEAQCSLLQRLIKHLKVKNVLEFGSSLGISAAYMAQAGARVISMEGSYPVHQLAKKHFSRYGADYRLGPFEDILPGILVEIPRLDMAFVDGNHREIPTLRYFKELLEYVHSDSVIVFDDIHWSYEMEHAWEKIKDHDRVTLSVDLFWCGMVFFNPGLSGEDFTIRY